MNTRSTTKLFALLLAIACSTQMTHAMQRAGAAGAPGGNPPNPLSNDLLVGCAVGGVARLTSYALKDQAGLTTQQSLVGASVATLILTYAYQSNNNGGFNRGMAQLAAAFAAYVVSMYIVPTKNNDEKEIASAKLTVSRATT